MTKAWHLNCSTKLIMMMVCYNFIAESHHWELFLSEVNNMETIAVIEVNNDTYCPQKWIEKFPLYLPTLTIVFVSPPWLTIVFVTIEIRAKLLGEIITAIIYKSTILLTGLPCVSKVTFVLRWNLNNFIIINRRISELFSMQENTSQKAVVILLCRINEFLSETLGRP